MESEKKLFWPAACVYDKLCGAHKQQYRISFDISRCAGWQRETRRRVKTTTNLVPACWRTILMYVCAQWRRRVLAFEEPSSASLRKLEFANLLLPAVLCWSVCLFAVWKIAACCRFERSVAGYHTLCIVLKKASAERTHTRWDQQLIKVLSLNHNFMPHGVLNWVKGG